MENVYSAWLDCLHLLNVASENEKHYTARITPPLPAGDDDEAPKGYVTKTRVYNAQWVIQ